MLPFLRDLARDLDSPRTVLVVDETGTAPPRQYQLEPRQMFAAVGGFTLSLALLLTAIVILSPIRQLILGPDPETLRETAQATAIRAAALSDSLEMQRAYVDVIRATLTGVHDTARAATDFSPNGASLDAGHYWPEAPVAGRTDDWEDHQPAGLTSGAIPAGVFSAEGRAAANEFLTTLQFPALPPVSGFFARGYEAARGHFGIDIAVDEDTPIRSIGDGYVVFADWTNDGGYVVAVQHAEGFLSMYKHNRRLLKRVGDRVRSRETIAMSGNTGQLTTGPHLHFELWRNGLAQDPRLYLVGL